MRVLFTPGADEVLLIAKVPKLSSVSPNRVDNAIVPWGVGTASTAQPAWSLHRVTTGTAANISLTAEDSNFTCQLEYQASAVTNGREVTISSREVL